MSDARFDANDPRLTAYVLGELEEADRAAVERQIAECEQTRRAVEEIRELTGLLTEKLESEQGAGLTDEQKAAVLAASSQPAVTRQRRWVRAIAGLALVAAVLLVAVFLELSNQDVVTVQDFADPYKSREQNQQQLASLEEQFSNLQESQWNEQFENMGGCPGGTYAEQITDGAGTGGAQGAYPAQAGIRAEGESGAFESSRPADQFGGLPGNDPASMSDFESFGGLIKEKESVQAIPSRPQASEERQQELRRLQSERLQQLRKLQRNNRGLASTPAPASDSGAKTPALRTFTDGRGGGGGIADEGFGGSPPARFEFGSALQQSSGEPTQRFDSNTETVFRSGNFDGGRGVKIPAFNSPAYVRPPFSDNESYAPIIENPFLSPLKEPLATFGIDVDTATYANVRRFLNQGQLPPRDAVRIEELINYFAYDDPPPAGEDPFSVNLETAVCPWEPAHRLVRIGIKGKEISNSERPNSNLVFLVDVSGSMQDANKLPLVKSALEMLAGQMTESDRIAIVTYAGEAALKLESTNGENKQKILAAIRSLQAGGSTNGEAGIKLAYAQALAHRIDNGTNRVILCTDGDFNVGVSGDSELAQMVQNYAKRSGVFLSIFGFGMGNLKDSKLEGLADKGNGHYGYVDGPEEAKKVFVEEMTGTLYTIAKDLKLQIEFNPASVGAYRLIGYENRLLATEDFDNDRKDAGDVGAGHSVTALFEIIPVEKIRLPVELKYQASRRKDVDAEVDADAITEVAVKPELLTLFLRYKQPDAETSVRREYPLVDLPSGSQDSPPSQNLQWAAAVAGFGMVIRESQYRGEANYDLVSELARSAVGEDQAGRRKEFLKLVERAKKIHNPAQAAQSRPADPPAEPSAAEPAAPASPAIGEDVQYWKSYPAGAGDISRIRKALEALSPQIKTKPGEQAGEISVFATKKVHDRLATLIPQLAF